MVVDAIRRDWRIREIIDIHYSLFLSSMLAIRFGWKAFTSEKALHPACTKHDVEQCTVEQSARSQLELVKLT
jgi:hypothetical protein